MSKMNSWAEGVGIIPNRTRVIIIYPTVDPQVVVVPIISSIFIFPILVFMVICCLRKMAARRRQLARLARDETWNERSCASIVQKSPPLSCSGGDKYGGFDEGTTTVELMSPDPLDDTTSKLLIIDKMIIPPPDDFKNYI